MSNGFSICLFALSSCCADNLRYDSSSSAFREKMLKIERFKFLQTKCSPGRFIILFGFWFIIYRKQSESKPVSPSWTFTRIFLYSSGGAERGICDPVCLSWLIHADVGVHCPASSHDPLWSWITWTCSRACCYLRHKQRRTPPARLPLRLALPSQSSGEERTAQFVFLRDYWPKHKYTQYRAILLFNELGNAALSKCLPPSWFSVFIHVCLTSVFQSIKPI